MASEDTKQPVVKIEESLFKEDEKKTAILLIDSSGSTNVQFGDTEMTVFRMILKICKNLGYENYRIVFWNGNSIYQVEKNLRFPNGVNVIPFLVKNETLSQPFAMIEPSINGQCLTFPHLGFNAIPHEWIAAKLPIFFVTDGEMSFGQITQPALNNLEEELRKSIIKLANARIHIITVEPVNRDFSQVESIANAAGSDILKTLRKYNLTGQIEEIKSYSLNHPEGVVQISKTTAPPGYIPYKNKFFSEMKMTQFMEFLLNDLKANQSEDYQIAVAQYLATTLMYLTKDKSINHANDIIRNFAGMFSLGEGMAEYIIGQAIKDERHGTAQAFASYRADLRNLFARANEMLAANVGTAVGLGEFFAGYPINGRILTGMSRLVGTSLNFNGKQYPNAGYDKVPVFPLDRQLSDIQEQCLRQFTRVVFADQYRINVMSDDIIYLVLGVVAIIVNSPDMPDKIKNAYRKLGIVMLKKNRLNSRETELERLERGDLPIPNSGRIDEFFSIMQKVQDWLGVKGNDGVDGKPMKFWHEICKAMGGKILAGQEPHCIIHEDYNSTIILPSYVCDEIPLEVRYDYQCLISLEDISEKGGYCILPHNSVVGSRCSPVYLISEEGKEAMENAPCPVCYTQLNQLSFECVGPKVVWNLPASYGQPMVLPVVSINIGKGAGLQLNANSLAGSMNKMYLNQSGKSGQSGQSGKTR